MSRQRDHMLADNPLRICGHPHCNKEHRTKQTWCPDCRNGTPTDDNDPIHVVYHNREKDGDVVYVGMGSITRAYLYNGSSASREPLHSEWLVKNLKSRHPNDVIHIAHSNLTKTQARELETQDMQRLREAGNSLIFNQT